MQFALASRVRFCTFSRASGGFFVVGSALDQMRCRSPVQAPLPPFFTSVHSKDFFHRVSQVLILNMLGRIIGMQAPSYQDNERILTLSYYNRLINFDKRLESGAMGQFEIHV